MNLKVYLESIMFKCLFSEIVPIAVRTKLFLMAVFEYVFYLQPVNYVRILSESSFYFERDKVK